jgi:hypothetical protein
MLSYSKIKKAIIYRIISADPARLTRRGIRKDGTILTAYEPGYLPLVVKF